MFSPLLAGANKDGFSGPEFRQHASEFRLEMTTKARARTPENWFRNVQQP